MQMDDIRCGHCRRKLGEGVYARLAIKCPRCGTLNHLVSHPRAPTHSPHASERPTYRKDVHGTPETPIHP